MEEKSIIVLTELNVPVLNVAGNMRITYFSKMFAKEGYKVYWCVYSRSIDKNIIQELYPNIFLIGGEKKKHKIINFLFSSLKIIIFLIKINRFVKAIKSDKIFFYPTTNQKFTILSYYFLQKLKKNKLFCDINEIRRSQIEDIEASESVLKTIKQLYLKSLQNYHEKILGSFYGIIPISTNIENYYKKQNSNMLRIPIITDALSNPIDVVDKVYNEGEVFKMAFTGSIQLKKEGFELLYKSLNILKKTNYKFELHLYGSILEEEKEMLLETLTSKYELIDNIFYYGMKNQNDVLEVLKNYHLLLLPRPENIQNHYGFSTKLSEYLISGTPTMVTNVSDNSIYIKDNINGYIVEPGDYELFARKLIEIIENYNQNATKIANNAYQTAKSEFDYRKYSKEMLAFIEG